MYLLGGCDVEGADLLRERLDELGDSVAIATSGVVGGYSVHVHTDDAGAAVEAGLAFGDPRRIQISALSAGATGLPPGSWTRERAVLAVVDGEGAAELFAGEGACVLRPGPHAADPLTDVHAQTLLRAVVDTGAAQVMVLPNGYVAGEELVAGCTAAIGWGIDVVPLPTGSMVQGLAALAVHEPGRPAVDDGYTMARAAGAARHGAVRIATEKALTWAGTCEPGNGLGIAGDEVLIVAPDVASAATGLIDLLLAAGGELVTALIGAGIGGESRGRCAAQAAPRPCARPPPGYRAYDLPHRASRRRAADGGRVAMATLSDRLQYIVGAKAADPLDEVFGIRTVDDLLRHYPRSYVEGTSVRSADSAHDEPPEQVSTSRSSTRSPTSSRGRSGIGPKDKLLLVTLGSGRSKVSVTFFHPKKWIKDQLAKGTRVMLSGEVSYFRGAMQLTHPDFLVLNSPDGINRGTRVAEDDRRRVASCQRRGVARGLRATLLPDLSGQHQIAELGYLQLRTPSARGPRPGARSVAESTVRQAQSGLRR